MTFWEQNEGQLTISNNINFNRLIIAPCRSTEQGWYSLLGA